jgi:hypothetical protein
MVSLYPFHHKRKELLTGPSTDELLADNGIEDAIFGALFYHSCKKINF